MNVAVVDCSKNKGNDGNFLWANWKLCLAKWALCQAYFETDKV